MANPPNLPVLVPERRVSKLALLSLTLSVTMPLVFIFLSVLLLVGTAGTILLFFIPYTMALIFLCALTVAMAAVAQARIKNNPTLKGAWFAIAARYIAFTVGICLALSMALCCVLPWYLLARESRMWREEGMEMKKTADTLVKTSEGIKQDMDAGRADTNLVVLVQESRAWRQSVDNLHAFNAWNWMKDSMMVSVDGFRRDMHLAPRKQADTNASPDAAMPAH